MVERETIEVTQSYTTQPVKVCGSGKRNEIMKIATCPALGNITERGRRQNRSVAYSGYFILDDGDALPSSAEIDGVVPNHVSRESAEDYCAAMNKWLLDYTTPQPKRPKRPW